MTRVRKLRAAGAAALTGLILAGCGSSMRHATALPTISPTTVAPSSTTTTRPTVMATTTTSSSTTTLTSTTTSTSTSTTTVPPITTTPGPAIDSQYVAQSIQTALVNESGLPATVTCPPLDIEPAYQYCTMHSPQDNTTLPVRISASRTTVEWALLENGDVTYAGTVLLNETTTPTTAPTTVPLPSVVLGNWTGRKPSTIGFSADAGNIISDITWSSWNETSAIGNGQWGYSNCVPDCASAKRTYYPATIILSAPVDSYFTRISEQTFGPHGFNDPAFSTSEVAGAS